MSKADLQAQALYFALADWRTKCAKRYQLDSVALAQASYQHVQVVASLPLA